MEDSREFEQELLTRMRDVGRLPDELALDQVEELVNELRDGVDWERHRARQTIETRRAKAGHLEILMQKQVPVGSWLECRDFYERVQRTGLGWLPEVRDQFAGDIAEFRQYAEPVARAAAISAAVEAMKACLTERISSTQIADRILREVAGAGAYLLAIAPTEEHRELVRSVREHVARYRWDKAMREAEVADASGPTKKGEKLRDQAKVLLRQDWTRIFDGQLPPDE